MRLRYVMCYGGPLDNERVRVQDPPPQLYCVPKPIDHAVAMVCADIPEPHAMIPRHGEYVLDIRRRIPEYADQLFEHDAVRAYRWDGWR